MMHYHMAVFLLKVNHDYSISVRDHFQKALEFGIAKRFQDQNHPFCHILNSEPAFNIKINKNSYLSDLEQNGLICKNKSFILPSIATVDMTNGFWFINTRNMYKEKENKLKIPINLPSHKSKGMKDLFVLDIGSINDVPSKKCSFNTTLVETNKTKQQTFTHNNFINKHPANVKKNATKYCLQNHEVSVEQFRQFTHSLDLQKHRNIKNILRAYQTEPKPDQPLENVSKDIAIQYADWLSRHTKKIWRLPSVNEWQAAALQFAENHPVFFSNQNTQPATPRFKNKPDHLIGNLREWSNDACPGNSRGIQLLGGNYLSGEQLECYHSQGNGYPGIGFRLLYEIT